MKQFALVFLLLVACGEDPLPKPRGYFRIGLPEKNYAPTQGDCPYSFEKNTAANITYLPQCWANLDYPTLKARVQLTYKSLDDIPLEQVLQDAHELALKHTVKADGIREKLYSNPETKVHGLLFAMEGQSASPAQFFVTDSANHFLRGVVYFNAAPNADSLRPAATFMIAELEHLVETLQWTR